MKIERIRGYAMSSPIEPPQDRRFHGGVRRLLKRDFVLVAVETADGEVGYAPAGASSSAMREYFDDVSHGTFGDLIEGAVADAIEGETIDDPADAHAIVTRSDVPEAFVHKAAAAVDIAVHDIAGKRAGAPIYELIGDEADRTRELPLYASAGMYMDPDGYAAQAATLADLGFFGYKYRPGIGPAGDRETVELIAERAAGIELMIDAHTWWKLEAGDYDRATVTDLIEHAGAHGAYWVEEPVEPDDYEGYAELAQTGVPLAGGESEESPAGLIALAEDGDVSFLQGDVRHHGGYTGTWEAVAYCAGRDVQFVPHNFGTWLGLVANAHLTAAAPDTDLLEYPVFEDDPALAPTDADPGMYPYPLAFDILADDLTVRDGTFEVPDGPGLGVTVDTDAIERYPHVEGPWTAFHYDEDAG